jgi:hypothetical protein
MSKITEKRASQSFIYSNYYSFPEGEEIVTVLDQLVNPPFSTPFKGLLLVGPSASGKTRLIKEFTKQFEDEDVLFLSFPESPSARALWITIHLAIDSTETPGGLKRLYPKDELTQQLAQIATLLESKSIVIIDRFDSLRLAPPKEQVDILSGLIALLSYPTCPPFVLVAHKALLATTSELAEDYQATIDSFASRFQVIKARMFLDLLSEEYLVFLKQIHTDFPLEAERTYSPVWIASPTSLLNDSEEEESALRHPKPCPEPERVPFYYHDENNGNVDNEDCEAECSIYYQIHQLTDGNPAKIVQLIQWAAREIEELNLDVLLTEELLEKNATKLNSTKLLYEEGE